MTLSPRVSLGPSAASQGADCDQLQGMWILYEM